MLASRSAKALHEKALLKVQGIRKLQGSPEKAQISPPSRSKRDGGKSRLMKAVRSSSHVLMVPLLSSSSQVFASPSQVVTLNDEFVYSFRNDDYGSRSRRDNTVGRPHGFIINWIEIFKNIKKVTEIVDVKNGLVDNSSL
ncbi:hypothetical protein Tco_0609952 [Tanacetum coccineum]